MNKYKFSLKSYDLPTPKLWKRIGDAILVCGTSITAAFGITGPDWVVIVGAIFTIVGKTLTEFFTEA